MKYTINQQKENGRVRIKPSPHESKHSALIGKFLGKFVVL
jgi:hypothetical protein